MSPIPHWVAQILGRHEWDAVNENWIENRQIGWRSTNGLENSGKVTFLATSPNQTQVDVFIHYTPPAGILGELGGKLGGDSQFEAALQRQAATERQAALEEQEAKNQQAAFEQQKVQEEEAAKEQAALADQDNVHGTLDGRNASLPHTPLGDRDARAERHPQYEQGPMVSRDPNSNQKAQRDRTRIPLETFFTRHRP